MSRRGDVVPDLHISVAELRKLRPADLLAIDGPKFIMREVVRGNETLAVLISHNKWRMLNHNVPDVNPNEIKEFFVGDQMYLMMPVECVGSCSYRIKSSKKLEVRSWTGLEVIEHRKPRKKAKG